MRAAKNLLLSFSVALSLLVMPAAAQYDPSIFTAKRPILTAQFEKDEQRIAVAEIGIEGGTLTTKAEDGTELRLVIPPRALPEKTYIYMYPIKSASKLPDGMGRMRGAVLAPDGLKLVEPAMLYIKTNRPHAVVPALAFDGNGAATRLTFSKRQGNETAIAISHFSGVAMPENWKQELTKAMSDLGARDLADTLISGAEAEAQKAREAGRDPDKAIATYISEHTAYSLISAIVSGFAKFGLKTDRDACKVPVWGSFLVGVIGAVKVVKAQGILTTGMEGLSPAKFHEVLATLPEEVDAISPEQLTAAYRNCFEVGAAVCFLTGDFSMLRTIFETMVSTSKVIKENMSTADLRERLLAASSGASQAVQVKVRKLLDSAAAFDKVISPETYREQVERALSVCARYEVSLDGNFKSTSYIGKGLYSTTTALKAIVSFQRSKIGDSIIDGKVIGETSLKLSNCRHVYTRPSCAYFSSSRWQCKTEGQARVEITKVEAGENDKTNAVDLAIDPGEASMAYNWCNQPCPGIKKTCIDVDWLFLLTFPYSPDNGPMRPALAGATYPVLVDGETSAKRVDPYGDSTFEDVSRIRVEHIGNLRQTDGASIQAVCRMMPQYCKRNNISP
jgi:hypothetical protein